MAIGVAALDNIACEVVGQVFANKLDTIYSEKAIEQLELVVCRGISEAE